VVYVGNDAEVPDVCNWDLRVYNGV